MGLVGVIAKELDCSLEQGKFKIQDRYCVPFQKKSSSSSSCRAASSDIPDPLSALLPIVLAGLQGYIPYPHIAAECMFELVILLLPGHMWGSIGVHHL